jgi:predicted component of type VI protein secretion system
MQLHQDGRRDEREARDADNILRFALSAAPGAQRHAPPLGARDFEKAFDLVERAAETIRVSERRIEALETRLQAVTAEAEKARDLVQAAKGRALAAEVRAEEAEMRAQEAEAWLRRMHDLIRERFRGANRDRDGAEPRAA